MIYKFRAYNKVTKTMIILDPLQWPLCALKEEDNWKVMMWTGLLDRFGKEIYEGDIVEFGHYTFGNVMSRIDFTNGSFCHWAQHNGVNSGLLSYINHTCKVVGNIHENQELLK